LKIFNNINNKILLYLKEICLVSKYFPPKYSYLTFALFYFKTIIQTETSTSVLCSG